MSLSLRDDVWKEDGLLLLMDRTESCLPVRGSLCGRLHTQVSCNYTATVYRDISAQLPIAQQYASVHLRSAGEETRVQK